LDKILQTIKDFFNKLDKQQKQRFISIAIIAVIALSLIIALATRTRYTVLYSGMDVYEAGEVYSRIQEMSVDVKLDNSNTIMVEESQADRIRMTLAAEGYPKSGFNYDLYSDNVGVGTSNAEKEEYMRYQLQDRLQRTITSLQGIENTIVTISEPSDDLFALRDEKPPTTASVVIEQSMGNTISYEQVEAIRHLVMTSISGLTAENISIIDTKMNLLGKLEEEGIGGMNERFSLEKSVQDNLEQQILSMTEPMFGAGNIRVAVSVVLDYDIVAVQKEQYEPVLDDEGIARTSDIVKEQSESTDTVNATDVIDNQSDTSRTQESIVYEINKTTQTLQQAQGAIKNITIAVIVNQEELDEETAIKVKELTAYSAGTTIEQVTVHATLFVTADEITTEQTEEPWWDIFLQPWLWAAIGGFFILLSGGVIWIRRTLKKRKAKKEEEQKQKELEEMEAQIEMKSEKPTAEDNYKNEIEAYINKRPEEVARLLKQWMHEE
jgi:flagellar M-ring protein FliF